MKVRGHFVDLFAGCGGFSLGLEQAGLLPVFVSELNDDALDTYLMNRRDINKKLDQEKYRAGDIRKVVADTRFASRLMANLREDYQLREGDIDLVVGGPPCQGFSGIGHRRSYGVERKHLPSNKLYRDMATVIRRLAPKAFVFENVRGLQSARWTENGRKGEIFDDVREAFDNLNEYRAAWSLLYARHYGVPQNRPRIFLVGIRNDIKIKGETADEDAVMRGFLPAPSGDAAPHPIDLLGDLIDPTYKPGAKSTETYPSMPLNELQYRLRSDRNGVLAEMGSQITDHVYSRHNEHVRRKFDAMRAPGRVVPEEFKTRKFSQRVIPKKWGPSGPTITATSMPDDYVHFAQSRTLTVREWARLQMFPDWYKFSGKRTTGGVRRAGNPRIGLFERELPKYTQIGNAVPVEMARKVGVHLAALLRQSK